MNIIKTKNFMTIGDLHGDNAWLEPALDALENNYHIIFMGDYCDSHTYNNRQILNNLEKVIDFKKHNSNKVTLLLGNHDYQYFFSNENFRCSGFRENMLMPLNSIFTINKNLFTIAFAYKNFLWTHAGITKRWLDANYEILKTMNDDKDIITAEDISNALNRVFNTSYFFIFNQVGHIRGGTNKSGGSPMWSDYIENLNSPITDINQIVGHSTRKAIEILNFEKEKASITFTDVLPYTKNFHYISFLIEESI